MKGSEGGLDWKSMSLSPKDMDFVDAEAKHSAREIALALGVPPTGSRGTMRNGGWLR